MFDLLNQNDTIHTIVSIGSMTLFSIGIFGLLTQKHLIKIFISIAIMETSLSLFFIGNIFNKDFTAPILDIDHPTFIAMNDPIPQAMILTAIVISMAVLALGVSFSIQYYKLTKNSDIDKMNSLRN